MIAARRRADTLRDMDVDALLTDLRSQGWATAVGALSRLEAEFIAHGMRQATTQRGAARQILRPVRMEDASSNTMSAVVGLGRQPLHTDGAHLRQPPDVVVLQSIEPSATPTRIWSAVSPMSELGGLSAQMIDLQPEFARYGLFTVRNGLESFLSPASDLGKLRVDPTCMSPGDDYAWQAEAFFQNRPAFEFEWDVPERILVIDNQHALHGRAALNPDDEGRALERRTYMWRGRS